MKKETVTISEVSLHEACLQYQKRIDDARVFIGQEIGHYETLRKLEPDRIDVCNGAIIALKDVRQKLG